MKAKSSFIYKVITILVIMVLGISVLFACGEKKKEEPAPEQEKTVEFTANSPLGIAESYVGSPVQELIEALGTLKGDPVITPSNDGGGYDGLYEFDGFTAKTYAKSEDAEALVTEIIPDEDSAVYKESIKTNDDGGNK